MMIDLNRNFIILINKSWRDLKKKNEKNGPKNLEEKKLDDVFLGNCVRSTK